MPAAEPTNDNFPDPKYCTVMPGIAWLALRKSHHYDNNNNNSNLPQSEHAVNAQLISIGAPNEAHSNWTERFVWSFIAEKLEIRLDLFFMSFRDFRPHLLPLSDAKQHKT